MASAATARRLLLRPKSAVGGLAWAVAVCLAAALGSVGAATAQAAGWVGADGSIDQTLVGAIDAPSSGTSVTAAGMLTVTGWFVDTAAQGWAGADGMQVYSGSRDSGTLLGQGTVGLNRPDVATALGNPFWAASGWVANVDASQLPPGQATLNVYLHSPGKGWVFQPLQLNVQQGEQFAPAPAAALGPPPTLTVATPGEGDYVKTSERQYVISGQASDPVGGAGGIDWVELWLNGPANTEGAIHLGDADQQRDGTWSMVVDMAQFPPINANLYVYAHSGITGKRTQVIVHFYITNRRN